jgi:hypothetical protein
MFWGFENPAIRGTPMAVMTDDEWNNLYENFETTRLLTAVDSVDRLRDDLNDQEQCRPPAIRDDLLKLHVLAMAVINNGSRRQAPALFDLAGELDFQVGEMMEALEQVRETLSDLVALYPESLDYADDNEDEPTNGVG